MSGACVAQQIHVKFTNKWAKDRGREKDSILKNHFKIPKIKYQLTIIFLVYRRKLKIDITIHWSDDI